MLGWDIWDRVVLTGHLRDLSPGTRGTVTAQMGGMGSGRFGAVYVMFDVGPIKQRCLPPYRWLRKISPLEQLASLAMEDD